MRVLRRNCGREVSLLVPLLAQSRDPPTQGVLTGHKVALPSRVPTSTILERTVERCTGVQAYCHNGNDTEELSEVRRFWHKVIRIGHRACSYPVRP